MRKFFHAVYITSLVSVCLLLAIGAAGFAAEVFLLEPEAVPARAPSALRWAVSVLCILFFASILVLWLEACMVVIRGWRKRAFLINLALVVFVLCASVPAAYVLHFINRRLLGGAADGVRRPSG